MKITYLIDKSLIDEKTQIALKPYLENEHIDEMIIFPDIHYSNEKALPVGVSFSSDKVFPLITGNDIGCLLVMLNGFADDLQLNSCSHGAGRKLSRSNAIKYWKNLSKKQKDRYRSQFQEMLNKNGDFDMRYIQEMDFAYKKSDEILKLQPHLLKVTETKPICTIKLNI